MKDEGKRKRASKYWYLVASGLVLLLLFVAGSGSSILNVTVGGSTGDEQPESSDQGGGGTAGEHAVDSPIEARVTARAAQTEDSTGKALTAYVANGVPATLNIVSSETGELAASHQLPGTPDAQVGTRAMATGKKDRLVFIGLFDGRAYSYSVDNDELRQLPDAPGIEDESFWNAGALDDGRILFTTYPSARLLAFDPKSKKWQDFGSLGRGNDYAMGISSSGHIAYVGSGTRSPALWRVDTESGNKQKIALPVSDSDQERDFVYDTAVQGRTVYARVDSEDTVYSYDLKKKTWTSDALTDATRGIAVSSLGQPPGLFWVSVEGRLYFRKEGATVDRELAEGKSFGALRGHDWQDVDGNGTPESLVTVNIRGDVLRWDSENNARILVRSKGKPAPVRIRSLGSDQDGNILVGGFGSAPYFSRLATDGDGAKDYALRGQVESFGSAGEFLVVGTYPRAGIQLVPRTLDEAKQPRWYIKSGQDRPVDIEDLGDGRLAVATLPVYGKNGGAVSFVNTHRGVEDVLVDVSPGRSPLTLVHQHGKLFVGTGSSGGLGSSPDDGDGTVVVLDAESGKKLETITPLKGDATISSLIKDEEGQLWGWSVDSVFKLNPKTLEVEASARYSEAEDEAPYVRGRAIVDLGDRIAGSARGNIFVIDKKTLERKILSEGSNLVLGGDGALYYSRGATVYRWSFG